MPVRLEPARHRFPSAKAEVSVRAQRTPAPDEKRQREHGQTALLR
jgi:hypothetical protein